LEADKTFFSATLPEILKVASDTTLQFVCPSLESFTLTRGNSAWLLGNAFLLNVAEGKETAGNVNFAQLFQTSDPVGLARLKAFVDYFKVLDQLDFAEKIQVERLKSELPSNWEEERFRFKRVTVHDGKLEDVETRNGFVDFANAQMHIGSIIASATQEEVLFSMVPELFSLLPFVGFLEENEAVCVRNVKRIGTYSGYSHTFEYEGLGAEFRTENVLVMDAVQIKHFKRSKTDLLKCYLAFNALGKEGCISTGVWGCGAFGGNVIHKLIQQLMGAQLADSQQLFFSCYHRAELQIQGEEIVRLLNEKSPTFGWLVNEVMVEYAECMGAEEDDDFSTYSNKFGSGDGFYEFCKAKLEEL
jgi:poly(ADP-ribose) glycohydrolase